MVEIKRLKDCTISEGVKAWNVGFEGYYFDATTTPERFVTRLVMEGLSPDLSIVAFSGDEPVGIVKSGIREIDGKKVAWNGGTGVATSLRNQGVGKILIEEALKIYEVEGIDIATLEAISENERAIALYKKMGYSVIDDLAHFELKGSLELEVDSAAHDYTIEQIVPQQVSTLSFYKGMNPWQTHWQAAKEGEAILVKSIEGTEIGYAYFKRTFDQEGKHVGTILFQCEANPKREDASEIIDFMLNHVFNSFKDDIRRLIPNLPKKASELTFQALEKLGFKEIANQVYMVKELK